MSTSDVEVVEAAFTSIIHRRLKKKISWVPGRIDGSTESKLTMLLNLSCPAVSHNWRRTLTPLT